MDDFRYFVRSFIVKQKQDRWLQFIEKEKWDKIGEQLHKLDKDLNSKCVMYKTNGSVECQKLVEIKHISCGTYVDEDGIELIERDVTSRHVRDDSLIICRHANVAFYFSHEGYVWVCSK